MNKAEVQKVMAEAQKPTSASVEVRDRMSYTLAEAIHDSFRDGSKVYGTVQQAGALLRYQSLQLNGQFDVRMMNEAIEFMRTVVIIG